VVIIVAVLLLALAIVFAVYLQRTKNNNGKRRNNKNFLTYTENAAFDEARADKLHIKRLKVSESCSFDAHERSASISARTYEAAFS
jgi:hypothetical protein